MGGYVFESILVIKLGCEKIINNESLDIGKI